MTTLIIIFTAASLPACFAITAAHRAGYRGFIGFAAWLCDGLSREAAILSAGLRKFDEGRVAARKQWLEEGR